MMRSSLIYLAASLAWTPLAEAGFNLNSQANIAVYWGQNSFGTLQSQQRLSAYCSDTKLNIIPLAFMNGIQTPMTNFANAGQNCTVYSGTQLLQCPQLEEDITVCQRRYNKTILLSLGGATYTEGGFGSAFAAQNAAANIWNLFGPNTLAANRPFRTAVVDGFDFDFESGTQNTAPFAQQLRSLMDSATAAGGKKYYLSAAPQCPYPDVALNDILSSVALDFVMVQFYNNYCGASAFTPGAVSQSTFNMATWNTWARTISKNPNVRVFLGVPANFGAGNGFLPITGLVPVINYSKTFPSFGGVMMWDMSQLVRNAGFLDGVYAALAPDATSSTTSTSSTSPTTTSRMTTTSRTTTTTSRSTFSTSLSRSSSSAAPTTTGTQPCTQKVKQWGQCGGRGYTGPTQCEAPYTCVKSGEWWSDCR